uniref:BHLH domain-containing protein n=1 Tax=Heterorhabditis bacteriophora TaxID=37862 RepID=A0A1I7XTB1_HETBA
MDTNRQGIRERLRQRQVNEAFANLRRIIPSHPINKKMSKHEILRGAIHYMTLLEQLLNDQPHS